MESLEDINQEILESPLKEMYPDVTNVVPGEGNPSADILFIGEAPGKDEDKQGRPFVGRAGKVLNELLDKVGMTRKEVYITNIIKVRPPNNRDPSEEEKEKWAPFLDRQIKAIKPKIIATLGRHSMTYFLPGLSISKVHGEAKRAKGIWSEKQIYFPLYHPAVALYNPSQKTVLLEDMMKLQPLIKKIDNENIYAETN